MSTTTRKFGSVIIAIVALALVLGVTFGVTSSDSDKANANGAGKGVTLPSSDQQALTVRPEDLLPKAAKCTAGDKASFEWRSAAKKWSDSVSTAFKSSDAKEMLNEVLRENCTSPVTLDMNIQALSKMTISGFNVADHNPWIGEFLKQAKSAGLNKSFLQYRDAGDETIIVTPEFQEFAAMANTLILNFENVGVVSEQSVKNWHLPSLVAGEVPRTKLNPKQEGLPVLRLEYTAKGQGCVFAYGYNVGDKRVEFLSCVEKTVAKKSPKVKSPKVTKPETHKPKVKSPKVTKPKTPKDKGGGCDKPCGGLEPKDYTQGTQHQGNNKPGGGGKAPTQTDPVGPPKGGNPPVTYTPSPKPTPKPEPRPNPVPAPGPGAPDPTEAPGECSPAPGQTTCP